MNNIKHESKLNASHTVYTVHIYREMRLRFDGIEAESPEQAAELARDRHFDQADDWSDCEGESFSALMDVEGDEQFEQSQMIDFEPGRMLKAAPDLLWFTQQLCMGITSGMIRIETPAEETLERVIRAGYRAIAKATGKEMGA